MFLRTVYSTLSRVLGVRIDAAFEYAGLMIVITNTFQSTRTVCACFMSKYAQVQNFLYTLGVGKAFFFYLLILSLVSSHKVSKDS